MHRNVLVATLLVALAIATVSCGRPSPPAGTPPDAQSSQALNTQQLDANTPGDIPDNQAFVAFTAQDHSFTVDVPEGWARTNSGDGATFSDTFNSMAIASRTGTAAPTPEGARLTELAEIAVANPSVSNGDVSTVTRPAGRRSYSRTAGSRLSTPSPESPQRRLWSATSSSATDRRSRSHWRVHWAPTTSTRGGTSPIRFVGRRDRRSRRGGGGTVLEAVSLYRFFRAGDTETLALQGVSLNVDAGEMVAVSGPSGSGKSTLLACLAGMDDPDGGTVRIDGQRMSNQPEHIQARMRSAHVGMLFQSANMLPNLTVAQNVRLPQRLRGRSGAVRPVLSALGIEHRARAYPDQLSGESWSGRGWRSLLPTILRSYWPMNPPASSTAKRSASFSICSGNGCAEVRRCWSPATAARCPPLPTA